MKNFHIIAYGGAISTYSRTEPRLYVGFWGAAYITSIALINSGFSHVPMLPLPGDGFVSPVAILAGFTFILRDMAQRQIGHGIIILMAGGLALSVALSDPQVVVASAAAFAIGELTDWVVYTFSKKPFRERVLWSSMVSAPVDTFIFLIWINQLTGASLVAMTASKVLAATFVFFSTKSST